MGVLAAPSGRNLRLQPYSLSVLCVVISALQEDPHVHYDRLNLLISDFITCVITCAC